MKFNYAKLVLTAFYALLSFTLHAETQPKFSLIPTTKTTWTIPANGSATLQYRVTNQLATTKTLTIVPLLSTQQETNGAGYCQSPFTLAPQESCLLTLLISGNQLTNAIHRGPEVCKTKGLGDNSPTPFLCSQPSDADRLNITPAEVEVLTLTIDPTSTQLAYDSTNNAITVTNPSETVTATNIAATLPSEWAGIVTQTATDCVTLLPGHSCQLLFAVATGTTVLGPNTIPIQGTNTQVTYTEITVGQGFDITGSPLTLTVGGADGILTITNTSSNTEYDIQADLSGHTTQISQVSGCASVNAGDSCIITFTPIAFMAETPITIQGSNTIPVVANIAVNDDSTEIPISISVNPTLALLPNGSSNTMTIRNDSETTAATNIVPILTNTSLNNLVTYTTSGCDSVAAGGTCTITFTPGSTAIISTGFDIQGSNTNVTTGTISIQYTLYASFAASVGEDSDSIKRCYINADTAQVSGCATETAATGFLSNPEGVAFSPSGSYLYVANAGDNTITKCTVNKITGALSSCADSGASSSTFSGPTSINVNSTYAYITNITNSSVTKCTVSSSTGGLSSCIQSSLTGLSSPTGSALSTSYLYIINNNGKISSCPIESSGTLGTCTSNSVIASGTAWDIALNSTTEYAYVTESVQSEITQHEVSGSTVGADEPNPVSVTLPFSIALNAANTYAYVSSTASQDTTIKVCTINGSTGALSGCIDSGAGTFSDQSILGLRILTIP